MALSVAQLIALALQDANCPNYLTQGGQKLNLILQELAQDWDFAQGQGWLSGLFDGNIGGTVNSANVVPGSGPYQLPNDFLRFNYHDFFWQNGGINYFPTPLTIEEFDELVQQPGFSTYPSAYSVDTSTTPYGLYVWPAPSAAYPYFGRYQKQNADIATPETSSTVPWFPSQQYMLHRLTAEMMVTTGDKRAQAMMQQAMMDLNQFIKKEGNNDTTAVTSKLDQRHFGPSWRTLPGTKIVPW